MRYGKIYFEDVKVGDELPALVKGPLERIQLTRYAGASGDFNPIHQDDEFAKAAGMGGVFAHGMLSMGFVAQAVSDWAGAGRVRKLVELDIWAENGKGEKVVAGKATVALPARD